MIETLEISVPVGEEADAAEAVAILRRAAEIISDRKRWTKGAYARNRWGNKVRPDGEAACRFCPSGAVIRADVERNGSRYRFVSERHRFDVSKAVAIAIDALMIGTFKAVLEPQGFVMVPISVIDEMRETVATLNALAELAGEPPAADIIGKIDKAQEDPENTIEFYELLQGLNDLDEARHEQIIAAFEYAIERLDNALAVTA